MSHDPRTSRPAPGDLAPRPVRVVLVVAVVLQVLWAAFVLLGSRELHPHAVPSVIAGDPVVAEALARQYDELPGHPFAVTSVPTAQAARDAVGSGQARAALVVSLAGSTDTVYLSAENSPALDSAIRDRVGALEGSVARSVHYQTIGPADADERRGQARLAVVVSALLGFLIAVGTSLRFGPVARDLRRGTRRAALAGAGAAGLGWVAGALVVGGPAPGLATMLVSVAAVVVTFALEGLFGWAGLGVAVATFFATALTVFSDVDRYLVGEPWATLSDLGIPGAGFEATVAAALRGAPDAEPLATLAVWAVTGLLLGLVARAVRARHEVPTPTTPEGRIAGMAAWRLRVVTIVAPLTVTLLVLTMVVPRHQVAAATPRPSLAATTECVETGAVRGVDDLNRIAALRGTDAFRGGDVGADALLQDGRRVWLFGDTLRDGSTGRGYVRNSMLLVDQECIAAVVPGSGGAIIPNRAGRTGTDPVGYWPMSVLALPRAGYDLLLVTTQRVRTTGTGAFDFENLGLSVAVFVVTRGGTPQLIEQRDLGADLTGRDQPTWGAATALTTGSDGWLYVYGTATPGSDQAWGYSLRVARVRPDALLHLDAWRYWDGSGWSSQARDAAELIAARDGVSQTLSVFEQQGRWYALSKRNDLLGSDITVWTASGPTGPWSGGTAVSSIPQGGTGQIRYMPLAHPTLFPEPGTVVASYSTNDTDSTKVAADPLRYRPHFVRVTLPD